MDYSGPTPADLFEVQSLNRAYLQFVRGLQDGKGPPTRLNVTMLRALTELQTERLSRAPFLLFSLRDDEPLIWDRLFAADPQRDLFAVSSSSPGPGSSLVLAALGFIWQLAHRSPYTARLVSGAGFAWCEQLAECSIVTLLQRCTAEGRILAPIRVDDTAIWDRLLGPGVSPDSGIRDAALVSTLQRVLMNDGTTSYGRLRSAACRVPSAASRVAAKSRRC